jgi:ubiquinone/menaquinone biosynthesis C-methylase UbiE
VNPSSNSDRVREVFGERAATYTTSAAHTDPEVLARLVACARPQAHWTALDIATGTGHTAFALAPHVRGVTAVDVTPQMLAEAEKLKMEKGLSNVSFQVADAHSLPFPDETFDLLVSRLAPHHFSDIRQALAEMYRVLRRGGRLVIDDRSIPEDDDVDAVMNRLDALHDESHVRQYRPSQWRALLKGAGFSVESVKPYSSLRPLGALKRDASQASIEEIDRVMAGLTEHQKSIMQVTLRDGELHHLHFYVLLAAARP